jgi:diaminohydroxyphosphoribosylaminopyrimidine deaminase / 5-amino-6-(5-phosphoribosylamino)uracil reductase
MRSDHLFSARSPQPAAGCPEQEAMMARCLELAQRAAGHVSPNPLVGSVIVEGGEVIGEGWHEVYGGPHAERNAIRDAIERGHENRLASATLYVNLEPCSHHGKTPPCTDAVLERRIPRVVVGTLDPNPLVAGSGIRRLREAGCSVETGILERACFRFNEAFFHHIRTGRPLVTLKVAQTLDGHVATRTGDSRWVSGDASRRLVHRWRAELDAVLVGRGTAMADDPSLTVRHVEGRQPWRVVLDREGRLPATLKLFRDEFVGRTIVFVGDDATAPAYADDLARSGGMLRRSPTSDARLDLPAVLDGLGAGDSSAGVPSIQSVLVEAGPGLATALLERDLVDRLFVFIAPKIVGSGTPAIAALSIDRMADARTFAEATWEGIGEDMLFRGYVRHAG